MTYDLLGIERARAVFANQEDTTNTNITLTVRETSPDVPVIALAEHEDSTDILELSGCTHVLALKVRLGEYLANRVSAGLGKADIVGTVKGLQIAEFSARDTPLAGRTVRDTRLRERTGLNIVGLWHRGRLVPAFPGVPITRESIVVVVGTTDQLTALDGLIRDRPILDAPIPARRRGHGRRRRRPGAQEQGHAGARARPRTPRRASGWSESPTRCSEATPTTATRWPGPASPALRRCCSRRTTTR